MDAYIGEIRPFAFNWPPYGWMLCNGQTLNIQQYQVLFAVIGNKYGGDGQTTFKVPALNGNLLVGKGLSTSGTNYQTGQHGGTDTVGLTATNMPPHNHGFNVGTVDTGTFVAQGVNVPVTNSFISNVVEKVPPSTNRVGQFYMPSISPDTALNIQTLTPYAGGAQAHDNHQPYLAISYCICVTEGEFPPRP